jgi:hypothetical protein
MTEPFSIAASSFAVVGVADVTAKATVGLCRLLSEIKDAPKEIVRLRDYIKENTQLYHTAKRHLDDLLDPRSPAPFSTSELGEVVVTFNSSVGALKRELDTLVKRGHKFTKGAKTWERFRYVMSERDIWKSLENLEGSKLMLNTALLQIEGFVYLLLTFLRTLSLLTVSVGDDLP